MDDIKWMRIALAEAEHAFKLGEVPIGAVIVKDGELISSGHNLRESQKKATAHAELIAIEKANEKLDAWRLEGATLYVTVEPCPMCAGAIINSRIDRVVYGAADLKAGCAGTLMNLVQDDRFNHQVDLTGGLLEEESRQLLQSFFKKLRARNKLRKRKSSQEENA